MCHAMIMKVSCYDYEGVMPWLWRCHVMIMKVSCYESWRCHVMIMKVSCYDYEGVMLWLWRCHAMIMKVSCHDYEGVMLWLWRCHAMIMKVSYYDYEGVMSVLCTPLQVNMCLTEEVKQHFSFIGELTLRIRWTYSVESVLKNILPRGIIQRVKHTVCKIIPLLFAWVLCSVNDNLKSISLFK